MFKSIIRHLCNIWKALFQCGHAEAQKPVGCLEQIYSLQRLTENLRERLRDAESRILDEEAQHRKEMADLHACYKQQVENLMEKLRKPQEDNFNFD